MVWGMGYRVVIAWQRSVIHSLEMRIGCVERGFVNPLCVRVSVSYVRTELLQNEWADLDDGQQDAYKLVHFLALSAQSSGAV